MVRYANIKEVSHVVTKIIQVIKNKPKNQTS